MKSRSRIQLALTALVLCSLLASGLVAQEADLATEDDKMLYTLGMALAQQLGQFGITETELAIVERGLADAVLGRGTKVDLQTYGPKLQQFAQTRMSAIAAVEKGKSAEFVAQKAAEEGAVARSTAARRPSSPSTRSFPAGPRACSS
jgi:hypothetical protein